MAVSHQSRRLAERQAQVVSLIAIVCIFALTASLAGRMSHARVITKTTITSANPHAKFQRLDRDGQQWVAPAEQDYLAELPVAASTVPPKMATRLAVRAGDQFTNRPPPAA